MVLQGQPLPCLQGPARLLFLYVSHSCAIPQGLEINPPRTSRFGTGQMNSEGEGASRETGFVGSEGPSQQVLYRYSAVWETNCEYSFMRRMRRVSECSLVFTDLCLRLSTLRKRTSKNLYNPVAVIRLLKINAFIQINIGAVSTGGADVRDIHQISGGIFLHRSRIL